MTHLDGAAVARKAAAARFGAAANDDSGKESNSNGSRLQRRALAKAGPNAAHQGMYRMLRMPQRHKANDSCSCLGRGSHSQVMLLTAGLMSCAKSFMKNLQNSFGLTS